MDDRAAISRTEAASGNRFEGQVELANARGNGTSVVIATDADEKILTSSGLDVLDRGVELLARCVCSSIAVARDRSQRAAGTGVDDHRRVKAACKAGAEVEVTRIGRGELEPDILVARSVAEERPGAERVVNSWRAHRRRGGVERVRTDDSGRCRRALVLTHRHGREATRREDGGHEQARTVDILHRIAP